MARYKVVTKNDQELFEASGHLAFEMNLFDYCVHQLTFDPQKMLRDDPNLQNVFISGFPIHARNIIGFLYGKMDTKGMLPADDICAFQFFEDLNYWHTKCPPKTALLEEIETNINKRAAHLTYLRATKPDYWWIWVDVHQALKPLLSRFVDLVPHTRIDPYVINFETRWAWSKPENLPAIATAQAQ
ncbi:MAG: hypothetical protein ABI970_18535 [Chloroflexota bacterium]